MKAIARERMKVGTAVMALCLGIPVMAQADSSYDYRDRSDVVTRGWSDSSSYYDADRDRYNDNRGFYTDQYGDLDTMEDQEKNHRYRPEGYVTQDGYRSTASTRTPRHPNDL
ncbi:MAG: hypothetical protein KC592_12475, partial [Nitrospira sp.]|nr:hypothetical protein [Nitrospira sp.]